MNLLVFADLQAADGHERCFDKPDVPLQRWRVSKVLEFMWDIALSYDCKGLIDLGDLTDDRQSIPIPTIDVLMSGLRPFRSLKHNIKLIGNHEQWTKSPEIHSGGMYRGLFDVVDTYKVVCLPDCTLACVAFIDDPTEQAEAIKLAIDGAHSHGKPVVFLGHFGVVGASTGSKRLTDGAGLDWESSVDLALLGHIHKHQKIGSNAYYVGSPFQQDFGEALDEKFVGILDTSTLEVKWINTNMPRYRTVSLSQFKDQVEPTGEDRFDVVLRSFDESQDFLNFPLSSRGSPRFEYASTPVEHSVCPPSDQSESAHLTDFDLMAEYVRLHPPSGNFLTHEDVLDLGREVVAMV